MTKQEFAKIAMALRTYYPKEQIIPNEIAMELWYQELADIPFDVAQLTLRKWVSTNKWSPSIAEIRELAATVTDGELPDWGDGWAQVQRAFGRYGRDRKSEALASFDPITRKAVEYLGWRELCNSENPMQDRANFRQCFEAVAKREQLDRQTALPLHDAVAAIRIDFAENGRLRIGAGDRHE